MLNVKKIDFNSMFFIGCEKDLPLFKYFLLNVEKVDLIQIFSFKVENTYFF